MINRTDGSERPRLLSKTLLHVGNIQTGRSLFAFFLQNITFYS